MRVRWHKHTESPRAEHTRCIRRRLSTPELARCLAMGYPLTVAERELVDALFAPEFVRVAKLPSVAVPVVLVRGAIRVACRSKAEGARRLKVSRSTFAFRLDNGRTVKGWRLRRAA